MPLTASLDFVFPYSAASWGLSVWTMIQNFLSLSTWFLFFLSVEHLGESQLAATNVVRNISAFTFFTVVSFATTASTLASNLIGLGETKAVMPMVWRVVRLNFIVLTPVLVLIALFPDAVMQIFTPSPALHDAARGALYVLLSSYLVTIPAQILFYVVSGTGNTRTALWIEFVALAVYTVYITLAIFGFRVSLPACWLSEWVYATIAFALSFLFLRSGKWQAKKF